MRSIGGSRQTSGSSSRASDNEEQLKQWLAAHLAMAPPLTADQLRDLQLLLAAAPTATATSA